MDVSMYKCIYACMHVGIFVCTFLRMYACINSFMYVFMCVYMCIFYACMNFRMYISMCEFMYDVCDRLCGLVVRIRGPGFHPRRYQIFCVVLGLERGPLSLVRSNEELLE